MTEFCSRKVHLHMQYPILAEMKQIFDVSGHYFRL